MAGNPIVNLIVQGARARGLDPSAVLAVASQEGLSGAVGDQGSSFGPWQLHIGGAFPTGTVPRGQEQRWAMSPAGINYALDKIAGVAKGLKGPQAVSAIVSRFERPANPGREIAGANAAYGRYGTLPVPSTPLPPPQTLAPPPSLNPLRAAAGSAQDWALLNQGAKMFGLPPLPAMPAVSPAPSRQPTAGPLPPTAAPQPTTPGPRPNGKPSLTWLEHQAAPFGLTITSTTGGQHATHSYHYQSRAIDLGGPPERMAAAANYALQHPSEFTEMFYTGPGHPNFFISGGQVRPLSQLDRGLYAEHTNHVHWAR